MIITSLFSCRGERWDDKLTLPKQDYYGNELRIDGYYYNYSDSRYEIYFLFHNGTMLYGGVPLESELAEREQSFIDGSYYSIIKNSKTNWGRFIIEGNTIKQEYWPASTGGPLEAYTVSGVILNDTTFKMTKSWRSCKPKKKKEKKEFETVYHFKQFSPKPDSTNAYTN